MTTPDMPLLTCTEVTAPGGRTFVTAGAGIAFRERDGYRKETVRGFDHPQGIGFVVRERLDLRER